MKTLRVLFGDQLSQSISSLEGSDISQDIILMCESWEEATFVQHHKKKLAFIFSAMRHFAQDLTQLGFKVHYHKIEEGKINRSYDQALTEVIKHHKIKQIVVTAPTDYGVLQSIRKWEQKYDIPVEIRIDHRFLCSPAQFREWAKGKSLLRMEYFYRHMRKKYNVLMEGDNPVGGQWNYDAENRKPPKEGLKVPKPYTHKVDEITREVIDLVSEKFPDHFGDLEPFYFAVTREQALEVLAMFIDQRLTHFGDYQDAMIEGEPWMYHSHLSFYLNSGLLLPLECIKAAEAAYRKGKVPLNAAEGFIRQIMGWREYVRGVYCLKMPTYAEENFFQAKRNLPYFYWTADTKMNCLKQCVQETKQNAYAHHIQRLMVLGNFALLAGVDPKQVNEWFLIVYADAYEWVELPNVSGMILFADGGYLASKPYAAGGTYINKMSNYCKNCSYKVTEKNGSEACPFNYLYWDFLARNRKKLESNPRIGMVYKTYDRMDEAKKKAISQDSQHFLKGLS
ncbi:MAG: cryptochrome/photolyase family protein [Alphaproteobacteria bacterium]